MLYSYTYAKKQGITLQQRATLPEVIEAFQRAGWSLGVPIIVIGGIYGGIFTPTEAAGIAAAYALFVALFIYKEMDFKGLLNGAFDSAVATAQIMILLAGASVFAWFLTRQQVPKVLAELMISFASSKVLVLLLINLILLIAGMFLDPASIQMIMAPLFLPVALQFNITPVHLGVIMVVNGAIGMFTPPFGLNLFVASGIAKVPLGKLVRTVIPFILISLISLLFITYIPSISLWLPRLLFVK